MRAREASLDSVLCSATPLGPVTILNTKLLSSIGHMEVEQCMYTPIATINEFDYQSV